MSRQHSWVGALAAVVAIAGSADAHFLFVRICPTAEGGRFGEVYFSDQADAGDPRFIEKIAHTKLWLQRAPGKFEPLTVHKTHDRLRALTPSSGSFGVIGECTYGVLARPKATAFLLRHYPKAVTGTPDEIGALQRKAEIPFEIMVRPQDGGLEFTVLQDGKPAPGATLTSVGLDLKGHEFPTDDKGQARWTPKSPGYYAVYTGRTLKEKGDYLGKKYDEIREFTTLAFAWPLQAEGADPRAVALFQDAIAARASWKDFPGFTANISARVDGRAWKGTVTISAKGDVDLSTDDEVVAPWAQEQLESLVMHRIARGEGKPPIIRFADEDRDHPLGRLLTFEGGKFASSYRVKDRQLVVVNRNLGKTNMTITVLENDKNAEGLFVPRSYTVQYWDAGTGALQRTESIQNRWTRVGAWDLPTLHTVLTASGSGQSVKTMKLEGHKVLSTK